MYQITHVTTDKEFERFERVLVQQELSTDEVCIAVRHLLIRPPDSKQPRAIVLAPFEAVDSHDRYLIGAVRLNDSVSLMSLFDLSSGTVIWGGQGYPAVTVDAWNRKYQALYELTLFLNERVIPPAMIGNALANAPDTTESFAVVPNGMAAPVNTEEAFTVPLSGTSFKIIFLSGRAAATFKGSQLGNQSIIVPLKSWHSRQYVHA